MKPSNDILQTPAPPEVPSPHEFPRKLWETVWTTNERLANLIKIKEDHEERLRKIEYRAAWFAGVISVLLIVVEILRG